MNVYFAEPKYDLFAGMEQDVNLLVSYYYLRGKDASFIGRFRQFMLDSGAFSFFGGGMADKVRWDEYIEMYADFVQKWRVEKYLELDIDSLVGYQEVRRLRERLESLVGRPCIPVWHKSRGMEDFRTMCDQYRYVAIGGIVSREIKPSEYRFLPALISEAHRRNARIHGLGFTNFMWLDRCHFDSVDSSSVTEGRRFGRLSFFNGAEMAAFTKKHKKLNRTGAYDFCYRNWVKFSIWARDNL